MATETKAITAAKAALEAARAKFESHPSGANIERIEKAQAEMDAALDSWASQSRVS